MRALWLVLALSLAACGSEPDVAIPDRALAIGEALPQGLALAQSERPEVTQDVASRCGSKATVFYAWSVPCPCIENTEPRIQKLIRQFGSDVAWVAVAGEPQDTLEQIREKKLRLGCPYPILLDPTQTLCKLLRFDSACQIAILDRERRLVYGGALDAHYVDGKGEYLVEALSAVLAGGDVSHTYRERTYGCFFNDPASCTTQTR